MRNLNAFQQESNLGVYWHKWDCCRQIQAAFSVVIVTNRLIFTNGLPFHSPTSPTLFVKPVGDYPIITAHFANNFCYIHD